ncbi:MAG: helix-turn-helix domain-containing protein [Acetanaerobacterium sp.]
MLDLTRTTELAKERGLSNTFLAKKLGRTSASLFVDWRKGKSSPAQIDIEQLAILLDTSVDYLTGKTSIKNKPTTVNGDELSAEDLEALEKFRKLSPDAQQEVLNYLRYKVDHQ